ncbi:hypothetical protein F5Y05DRAFT_301908 [Hypoxylon sp. FL0543]|nr:hypothetical protein F5Y05DRAFT_301908 [Hypoxylon sp. FL0543]
MFPGDFSWKRLCTQTLVWSGLLFTSRCDDTWTEGGDVSEVGVLGSPVEVVSTITVTTMIAYNPTLAPGDSTYSLEGCYSHDTDTGGHPFGQGQGWGYDTPPTVPLDELTIVACVNGCTALKPVGQILGHYQYIGLWNGWQCICGTQLVPEARKLPLDDCNTPCNGDPMHLCGGKDAIAVYSIVGIDDAASSSDSSTSGSIGIVSGTNDQNHDSKSGAEDENGSTAVSLSSGAAISSSTASDTTQLKATGMSQSAVTGLDSSSASHNSKGASGISETTKRASVPSSSSSSSTTTPSPSDLPGGTISSSAIGAITGSLSGVVILTAGLFLCFRAYKRKKQRQETNVSVVLEHPKEGRHSRRLIPSAIDTTGIRGFDRDGRAIKPEHGRGQEQEDFLGSATDVRDFVPTTPALESGGRLHASGLHSRRKSAASPSDRDSLYGRLLDEVRAGPASPFNASPPSAPQQSGASSAVDWRSPVSPATPKTAPAVAFEFGFNARNRSTSSLITTPVAAARPDATLGDRAWHRRKISATFQPPASGPPSIPLPPTPTRRSTRSIDAILLSSANASTASLRSSQYKNEEKGESSRSTGPSPTLLKPKDFYALGVSANQSLPSLGTSAPTPPPREPSRLSQAQTDPLSSNLEERVQSEGNGVGEEATAPTLPIIQDELLEKGGDGDKSGSGSTDKREVEKEDNQENGKGKGAERSRLSAGSASSTSTVDTSILFPSEDEHAK